ncbi:MAG: hypothetical protein AABM43_04720 [Actinomycetota bacterium]
MSVPVPVIGSIDPRSIEHLGLHRHTVATQLAVERARELEVERPARDRVAGGERGRCKHQRSYEQERDE